MGRMRRLIFDSWQRSVAAGLDADGSEAQPWLEHADVIAYRDGHILAPVFPLLYDVLGRAAEDCDCVMAIGDRKGRLLWVSGKRSVKRRAEDIRFMEGVDWGEASAGTNAPGTALRLDAPLHVCMSEHFSAAVKAWSCAAAPIHHPETQELLGVVDVTGTTDIDTPQTLAMVRSAARMAESELGRLLLMRRAKALSGRPPPPRTPSSPVLELAGLGRPDLQMEWNGRTERLSPRHGDIVAVLADQPEGVTGERLALDIWDEDVQPSTVRAQMTRLRSLLGEDLLRSRPYRMEVEIRADWMEVTQALEGNQISTALRLYRGPLLPASEAPGVVQRRTAVERQLISALLTSRDIDLLASATRSRWASDNLELWERQMELLPPGSPLATASREEVRRLRAEYGIPVAERWTPRHRGRMHWM